MSERRYFTEQNARDLLDRRVQARVAISRHWLRDLRLWVGSGSLGTVTQFASGSCRDEFLVGVLWDDLRSLVSRSVAYPIDWYTEDEYRDLLEASIEEAA